MARLCTDGRHAASGHARCCAVEGGGRCGRRRREEAVPTTLPVQATTDWHRSLEAAARHAGRTSGGTRRRVNADGTVNGYVEIRARRPAQVGIRHGRQPARRRSHDARRTSAAIRSTTASCRRPSPTTATRSTCSCSALPIDGGTAGPRRHRRRDADGGREGPRLEGGDFTRVGPDGRPLHALTDARAAADRRLLQALQAHETGKFSKVPGWGTRGRGPALT